jgi:glycosyltransferase 2 family protein
VRLARHAIGVAARVYSRMRRASILAFVAGLAVITLLVVSRGADAVWHALAALGWPGFVLICLCHLALIGLMGLSWRAVVPNTRGLPHDLFFWARLVRDSGAEILPLSQLGGFVIGARAATLSGVPSMLAAASSVVDVTLELFAQLAFTALGLALLVFAKPGTSLALPVTTGLGIMLVAAIAFVAAQRRGLPIVDRIGRHLLGDRGKTGLTFTGIVDEIAAIYDRPGRVWLCAALHFACWICSGLEAWLAVRLMGVTIDVGAMLTIESLLYAVRSAAFAVPNAVGVQEGAYVVLGVLFGLAPETLLALSLLKRARDLTLGVPALLSWQIIEARRVLAQRAVDDRGPQSAGVAVGVVRQAESD